MGPEDGDYLNLATQITMCQAHWDNFKDGVNFKDEAKDGAESEGGVNANRGSDPNHRNRAGV